MPCGPSLSCLLHVVRVLFYDFRQSDGVWDDECDVTECVKADFSSVKYIYWYRFTAVSLLFLLVTLFCRSLSLCLSFILFSSHSKISGFEAWIEWVCLSSMHMSACASIPISFLAILLTHSLTLSLYAVAVVLYVKWAVGSMARVCLHMLCLYMCR